MPDQAWPKLSNDGYRDQPPNFPAMSNERLADRLTACYAALAGVRNVKAVGKLIAHLRELAALNLGLAGDVLGSFVEELDADPEETK